MNVAELLKRTSHEFCMMNLKKNIKGRCRAVQLCKI